MPARIFAPDVVSAAAPIVRPWKPPSNATIVDRPVAWRASRTDASTASEPELTKNTRVDAVGQHVAHLLGELEQRLVHHGRVLAVDQRADLLLRGRDDLRVAVPGAGDADAGGEVQVPAAVGVVEVHTLAAGGLDRGGLLELRGQLCHGSGSWNVGSRRARESCRVVDNPMEARCGPGGQPSRIDAQLRRLRAQCHQRDEPIITGTLTTVVVSAASRARITPRS